MIWLLWLPVTLAAPRVFPLVDPGLFVISGVRTCGGGDGYCLLGLDCTLDEDFLPDDEDGQHCEGLRSAFTPSAHFVCCKATNKTVYKPPIAFPPEPMTTRTTTLDVLENEIGQVLLKVAESVDAAKRTPATEPTQQTDFLDHTAELRESAEVKEGSQLEEMLADSPEEELSQGNSYEDDDLEEVIQKDDKIKDPTPINEPPPKEQSTQNNPPQKTVTIILNPNFDESSEEMSTEENIISMESSSNEPTSEESDSKENSSVTTETDTIPLSLAEHQSKPEDDHNLKNIEKDVMPESTSEPQSVNEESAKEEIITENVSLNTKLQEIQLKNNTLEGNTLEDLNGSTAEDNSRDSSEADDLNTHVTSKPDLLADQATSHHESNLDAEWTVTEVNPTTKQPHLEKISNDQIDPSTKINPPNSSMNEIVMTTTNVKDQDGSFHQIIKNEKIPLSDDTESDSASDVSPQTTNTTEADEDQSVTSASVTPAPVTQTADNEQPPAAQGQPEVASPCSRRASGNCSEEVKFVFEDHNLCFGSVFSLDWVVTSASCALRIFRAGMVNVSIAPLTDGVHTGSVKTIVVHESYGENAGTTGQEMEANNIGLVQLKSPLAEWAPCVPCLPEAGQQFSTAQCSAVVRDSTPCSRPGHGACKAGRVEGSKSCEGEGRQMKDDHGFLYLTLACDNVWEPRFSDGARRGSGAPMFCDGLLAGVQSSSGVGMVVYTPLSPYLDWLQRNTHPDTPEQRFNLG